MGDSLELRLSGIFNGAYPNPLNGDLMGGMRFNPRAVLNLGDFFFEIRPEFAASNYGQTPLGENIYDSTPSGSLSVDSPLSLWAHRPTSDTDLFRANFGFRSLSAGWRISPDWTVRLGPHRYDIVEPEPTCMAGAYASFCKYSFLSSPMGWFGGEVTYDRRRDTERVRRVMVRASGETLGYGGGMGMLQGLGTFALSDAGASAPTLTLMAWAGLQSNPPLDGDGDAGISHSEGGLVQFDYDAFLGAVMYGHRDGASYNLDGWEESHTRDMISLWVGVNPGDWRFRASLGFLNRTDGDHTDLYPPSGRSEIHTEFNGGYQLTQGLTVSAGYRGFYGERDGHMAFLGLISDMRWLIPF